MKLLTSVIFFLISVSVLAAEKADKIFEGKTSIEKPFEVRDPFQPPRFKSQTSEKTQKRIRGILDNIPKAEFKYDLTKVRILGVLIGKERRVIVQIDGETNSYSMKEGDRFGVDGPEVKAILPGGVILVEKINNIYDEEEFIETIIPISN